MISAKLALIFSFLMLLEGVNAPFLVKISAGGEGGQGYYSLMSFLCFLDSQLSNSSSVVPEGRTYVYHMFVSI